MSERHTEKVVKGERAIMYPPSLPSKSIGPPPPSPSCHPRPSPATPPGVKPGCVSTWS